MDEIDKSEGKAPERRGPSEPIERLGTRLTHTAKTEGLIFPAGNYDDVPVLYLSDTGGNIRVSTWAQRGVQSEYAMERDFGGRYTVHAFRIRPSDAAYDVYCEVAKAVTGHPWATKDWWVTNWLRWVEHFPIPSATVNGAIAYYQSPDKRARDIRTPIKAGKYLKKYFGDLLSSDDIQAAALEWANFFAPRKLTVTQDADEIERVYRGNYNGSCMHFGSGGWDGSCHPARVYAGPDLGVAYIGEADKADGRCLVWPEKQIYYPKWYGDGVRLEAALQLAGYKAADEDAFDGARIRRIRHQRGFVMPYIDVCCDVDDDGQYLIIGGNEIGCRQTNGMSHNSGTQCYSCDEYYDDEEEGYVTHRGRSICNGCYEDHYFTCEGTGEVYHVDNSTEVNGRLYCHDYAEEHYFHCELADEWVSHDDTVELVDGRTCSTDYAVDNGFLCDKSEQYDLDVDNRVTLSDDRTVSLASFDNNLAKLRGWCEIEDVSIASMDDVSFDILMTAEPEYPSTPLGEHYLPGLIRARELTPPIVAPAELTRSRRLDWSFYYGASPTVVLSDAERANILRLLDAAA